MDYVLENAAAEVEIDFQEGDTVLLIVADGKTFDLGTLPEPGHGTLSVEKIITAKAAGASPNIFPITVRVTHRSDA